MTYARRSASTVRAGTVACLLLTIATSACREAAHDERPVLLAAATAQHVVGVWDITLFPDPRFPVRGADTLRPATGTIALTENRHGPLGTSELAGITHQGAADIDLHPLGWSTGSEDAPQVSVARVSPRPDTSRTVEGDSLVIVIGLGSSRFVVRLGGVVNGDDARGTWRASAFSGGGGEGRFEMHRRP